MTRYETAVRLRNSGLTLNEIGKRMGVTHQAISGLLGYQNRSILLDRIETLEKRLDQVTELMNERLFRDNLLGLDETPWTKRAKRWTEKEPTDEEENYP